MEKICEIILNDDSIDKIPDHLNLKVGEIFYFSLRHPSPRAEKTFRRENDQFKPEFVEGVLKNINDECDKFWIMEFIVTKVTKSYEKDYGTSIENPRIRWVETIVVEEYPSDDTSNHQMD